MKSGKVKVKGVKGAKFCATSDAFCAQECYFFTCRWHTCRTDPKIEVLNFVKSQEFKCVASRSLYLQHVTAKSDFHTRRHMGKVRKCPNVQKQVLCECCTKRRYDDTKKLSQPRSSATMSTQRPHTSILRCSGEAVRDCAAWDLLHSFALQCPGPYNRKQNWTFLCLLHSVAPSEPENPEGSVLIFFLSLG